mmetsp:Transcript_66009/g.114916  ORF Transcript_66009/g.114916 Transcript_66009/m.114916 type:complete len:223 (-) Transcript_66009:149-817(-)
MCISELSACTGLASICSSTRSSASAVCPEVACIFLSTHCSESVARTGVASICSLASICCSTRSSASAVCMEVACICLSTHKSESVACTGVACICSSNCVSASSFDSAVCTGVSRFTVTGVSRFTGVVSMCASMCRSESTRRISLGQDSGSLRHESICSPVFNSESEACTGVDSICSQKFCSSEVSGRDLELRLRADLESTDSEKQDVQTQLDGTCRLRWVNV